VYKAVKKVIRVESKANPSVPPLGNNNNHPKIVEAVEVLK